MPTPRLPRPRPPNRPAPRPRPPAPADEATTTSPSPPAARSASAMARAAPSSTSVASVATPPGAWSSTTSCPRASAGTTAPPMFGFTAASTTPGRPVQSSATSASPRPGTATCRHGGRRRRRDEPMEQRPQRSRQEEEPFRFAAHMGAAADPCGSARSSQGRACSRLVPLGLLPRQCRLRRLLARGASPTSALSALSDAWADDDGRSPAAPAPPPPSRPPPMPGPTPTPVRPRRRFRLRSLGPLRRQCHLRRLFARGACPATTCPDMTRERSEQHQHAEGSPRSRRTRPDAAAWRRLSTSRLCLRCRRRSGGRQTELWRSLLGSVRA